jgi:hypothetical protein
MKKDTEECLIFHDSFRKLNDVLRPRIPDIISESHKTPKEASSQLADSIFNEDFNKIQLRLNKKDSSKNYTCKGFKSNKNLPKLGYLRPELGSSNKIRSIIKRYSSSNEVTSLVGIKDKPIQFKLSPTDYDVSSNVSGFTSSFKRITRNNSTSLPHIDKTVKFIENSKKKVDDSYLSKENKNIKNFLCNFIHDNNKKKITRMKFERTNLPKITSLTPPPNDGSCVGGSHMTSHHNLMQNSYPNINTHYVNPPHFHSHTPGNVIGSQLITRHVSIKSQKNNNNNEPIMTDENKLQSSKSIKSYFQAIASKLERIPTPIETIEDELDIEDIDFPLNPEHLAYKSHYLEKFNYKLFIPNRELITMRNIYDSMSDEDELLEDKQWYTINPIGIYKMIWDIVAIGLAIFNLIVIPYELAFDLIDMDRFYIHLILDIFFMIDWMLFFLTGYIEDDKIIYNVSSILNNYTRSYRCYVYLISSFPFESFIYTLEPDLMNREKFVFINRNRIDRLMWINRFVKYFKWIEVFRVFNLSYKIEVLLFGLKKVFHINLYLKTMIGYIVKFMCLIYLATCFWCYLGYRDDINGTWITYYNLTDSYNGTIFVSALYFVMTTMFTIGYGDITAKSSQETLYVCFLMTLGSLIWSFLLTAFSQFFITHEEKKKVLNERIVILDNLKTQYQLPETLLDRLRKAIYYDYKYYKKDRIELMSYLPVHLKNELYLSMYRRQIANLKFFKNQSYDFIITVLPLLKEVQMSQGESVINKGDIVKHLYMVTRGILSVLLNLKPEKFEVGEVRSSYHIGDILMYIEDQSPYEVIVKTKICNLFVLARHDFAELKLSFKEAISNILLQSHKNYCLIEEKRSLATDYYNINKTFDGFRSKLDHTRISTLMSTSKLGIQTRKNMSHVSSLISDEIKLDTLIAKSRAPQTNLNTPQSEYNLGVIEEKGEEENDRYDFSIKYLSSAESSLEIGDNILPLNSSVINSGKSNLKEQQRASDMSLENISEAKEPTVLGSNILKPSVSISSDPSKTDNFLLSPGKKYSDARKILNNLIPENRRRSLFLNSDMSALGMAFNTKKRVSVDKTNSLEFLTALNQKIFEDIALQRNPEIVQDQIINLISSKNVVQVERQNRRLEKILCKLNQILVLNLKGNKK